MNLQIIKQYITPKKALDIGAHSGEFYSKLVQEFPGCQCLLVEGNPDCEPFLRSVGAPYHICLLGSENKEVNFYKSKKNLTCTGSSVYRELTEHYNDDNIVVTTLECHRLDDLNKNKVIFDFVKMDTQGSELDIFKGGIETLTQAKVIVMETSLKPYNSGAPLQEEVIEFMASYNFKKADIIGESRENGGKGDIFQQDILFVNADL